MDEQWTAMARLVRRTGFGASGRAVDAAVTQGPTAYLRSVFGSDPMRDAGALATPPPVFEEVPRLGANPSKDARHARTQQVAAQLGQLTAWWLRRMVTVHQPLGEKLTFCWHDHFATAATKVRSATLMLHQNQTLRAGARGDFRTLALAMLTDPAMLVWLDGTKNTAAAPNENLSREFMELFALGHGDGYTETDVREGARALTGWKVRADGTAYLAARQHDSTVKTFLGVTGDLDVTGYRDAVLARPAAAPYLVGRWWGQLASDTPQSGACLVASTAAYGVGHDLSAMMQTMLLRPEFAAAEGSLVIGPVEWLVGAARALSVPVTSDATAKKLLAVLKSLGQVPFYPPNVSGWPSGQAWLSTAAATARMQAGVALAAAGDVSSVADASPADRIDAVAYLLGIARFSSRTSAALTAQIADPAHLIAVALNSPEYLVH